MDLFKPETPGYELWTALAVFAGGLVGVLLLRLLWDVLRSGPRAVLRNGWRIEPETWRLIGILLFLGIAAMMVWTQWI
jgi:hypothetical protein